MKFREEVLAKIFTYITVLLLLTAIIFEAWTVRQERKSRAEAENEIVKLEGYIDGISEEKEQLKAENRELQAFQNIWSNYAAFMASHEVMSLKTDLFTRPDLIPKEAIEAYAAFQYDTQNESEENPDGEAEASGKKFSEKEAEAKRKEEIAALLQEFTFDNPNGENVFLPLSTGSKKQQTCLVYTNAYGKKDNGVIELLYEINFENMQDFQDQAADGAEDIPGITWSCAAYNVGNGWFGLKGEEKSE